MYEMAALFGNLLSGVLGQKSSSDSLKAQQRENQINRNFSSQMMDKANNMAIQQWNRENSYNLPTQQLKRLRDAGLNPDLFYGNGAGSLMSASSPSMQSTSSSGSVSPGDYANPLGQSVSDAAANAAAIAKTKAETDYIKAQTKGQGFQNEILSSDASFRDAFNSGQIETQNMTIRLGESNISLNDNKAKQLRASVANLNAATDKMYIEADEVRSRIANLDEQTAILQIEKAFKAPMIEAEIRKLVSSTNLDYANAKAVLMNATTNALVGESQASLNASQAVLNKKDAVLRHEQGLNEIKRGFQMDAITRGINISNDHAEFNLESDKTFKNKERFLHMYSEAVDNWTKILNTEANILGSLGSMLGGVRSAGATYIKR